MEEMTKSKIFAGFGAFLKNNRWALLGALAVALVSYGFMLTHYTLSIDEEIWVKNTDPELLKSIWLNQGHFGLFFFDTLFFPNGNYVPVLWDWFGVVLFTFGGALFLFGISMFYKNIGKFAAFIFCAMFPVLPFVTGDILAFSMYGLPMGLALVVMSFAVLFLYAWFRERKPLFLVGSLLLAFVATSFYQAFPGIYVVALLVYAVVLLRAEERPPLRIVFDVLWGILALGLAVAAYFVLSNTLQESYGLTGSGGYLSDGFIGWGTADALGVLGGTVRSIGAVLAGRIFGGVVVAAVTLLFFIFMIAVAVRKKKNRIVWVVGCLLLMISPFVMNMMLGTQGLTGRTMLGLPVALAAQAMMVAEAARKSEKPWLRTGVSILLCCVLGVNGAYMNFLFWMDHTAYQRDSSVSAAIMEEISGMDMRGKPVVFVGKLEPVFDGKLNMPASASFFNWDGGSNYRIRGFMNAEGYTVLPYTREQFFEAVETAENMPSWPEAGCVLETERYIVVKLSDPPEGWIAFNALL